MVNIVGLSSAVANSQLLKALSEVLTEYEEKNPEKILFKNALITSLFLLDNLIVLFSSLLLLIAFLINEPQDLKFLFEFLVVFIFWIINNFLHSYHFFLQQTEKYYLFKHIITTYSSRHLNQQFDYDKRNVTNIAYPPSDELISVQRDGKWIFLPIFNLVVGDLIRINNKFNYKVQKVEDDKIPLLSFNNNINNTNNINANSSFCTCILNEVPIISTLKTILNASSVQRSPITNVFSSSAFYRKTFIISSFFVGLILIIIYDTTLNRNRNRNNLIAECFEILSSLLLPLSSITIYFYFLLIETVGNAILIITQSILEQSPLIDAFPAISFSELLSESIKIFRGQSNHLVYSRSPLEYLGYTTHFSFVGRHGILADSLSVPEHILFYSQSKPIILDVISEPNRPSSIMFDVDYHPYISALKPLGLNCFLNSPCNPDLHMNFYQDIVNFHEISTSKKLEMPPSSGSETADTIIANPSLCPQQIPLYPSFCLCPSALEIGFEPSNTFEMYRVIKEIHTLTRRMLSTSDITSFSSIILDIQGVGSGLQLMSQGEFRNVLSRCRDVWDGTGLVSITPLINEQLSNIFSQWEHDDTHIIAFSYSPVPRKFWKFIREDKQFLYYVEHLEQSIIPIPDSSRSNSITSNAVFHSIISDVKQPNLQLPNFINQKDTQTLLTDNSGSLKNPTQEHHGIENKHFSYHSVSTIDNQKDLKKDVQINKEKDWLDNTDRNSVLSELFNCLQHDQIFLGAITTRTNPLSDAVQLVETCSDRGIRFALFLPEPYNVCQSFGSKLGLETDWNCFISLQDALIQSPMSHSCSQLPFSNRSKLPCGIDSIRRHIQDIDNVPLQVHLFTDALPIATAEMINILQENQDLVLTAGSSLSCDISPFLRSDMVFSIDPTPLSNCIIRSPNDQVPYNDLFEFSLVSSLSSLYSAFHFKSCNIKALTFLLLTAIQIKDNLQKSLIFAFSSYLSLFCIVFLGILMDTPSPISPLHNIYLMFFIIPILSGQLLFVRRNKKRDKIDKRDVLAFSSTHFLVFFLSHYIIPILLFLYNFSFLLYSSNNEVGSPFHLITTSDTEVNGITSSQSISVIFFTFHLTILSFCYISRIEQVYRFKCYYLFHWAISCFIVVSLSIIFMVIYIDTLLLMNSLLIITNLLFVPILLVSIDIIATYYEAKFHKHRQDKLTIEFETKLGMYSPK